MKTFNYEKAKEKLPWVKDVPKGLVTFIGISELIGCVGLIVPGVTGIRPILTSAAACGTCMIMVLGIGFHIMRGAFSEIVINLIFLSLAALLAYERYQV